MHIEFLEKVEDSKLKFAVIIAKHQDQYLWVRNKKRITWEIPGGKREQKETILACAKRELYEETGALQYTIEPVCVYNVVTEACDESYGMLYVAEIDELGSLPQSEIAEIKLFDSIPEKLTYPDIQPLLMNNYLDKK